ncbi:MAG: winged helix DNA-binding domain-containing protein [Undibacterium sp.]|nr:winged helix DNA-binding domain-containing protein [Opitutaceae bacterium]
MVRAGARPWSPHHGFGVIVIPCWRGALIPPFFGRAVSRPARPCFFPPPALTARVLPALKLAPAAARRFVRRALLLTQPAPDLATALGHHGYVQIDPINVCGRMHDLILRNRVVDYREGDLMRHLHGDASTPRTAATRIAFEHHLPSLQNILVAFPLEAWPHLHAANRARTQRGGAWSGKLDARQRRLAERILAEIATRGALSSQDIEDNRRDHHGWGAGATLAKTTLQKLFFHGRVLIARRVNQRRYYDLPERVLPAATLALPEPTAPETARWLATLKLRQRRLTALKREELRAVEDLVQPIVIEGCGPLYCLSTDVPSLLSAIENQPSKIENLTPPLLLAPLDPLIYDRRLTATLWGYDYTWEVYTPAARRTRGYYALPILSGHDFVGHVDPKADRENRKLRVISRRVRRGHVVAPAVRELANFLGLK